jgi:nucleoside-diphosphate-sugar epimerase
MLKKKKILITGAGGFIGAYFLEKLQNENDVSIIIRKDLKDYWRLGLFPKKYNVNKVDIQNRSDVFSVFSKERPDITFHFASSGTYPKYQKDKTELISTNIFGSMNVLDASLEYSDITINVGSSSEYGEAPCPMSENGPTFPTILYGVTKLFITHYARLVSKEKRKKLITIRPFSIYGPYEEPFRLIPYILSSIILNRKIKLSSPNNVRDFVFIEDFYHSLLFLISKIEHLDYGEIFNIGTGKETSIGELIKILEDKIFMRKIDVEWVYSNVQPEIDHWFADTTKFKNYGGILNYNLEKGLFKTYEWLKEHIQYYSGDYL